MLFGEIHVAYCVLLLSLVSLDSIVAFVEIFYSAMLTGGMDLVVVLAVDNFN